MTGRCGQAIPHRQRWSSPDYGGSILRRFGTRCGEILQNWRVEFGDAHFPRLRYSRRLKRFRGVTKWFSRVHWSRSVRYSSLRPDCRWRGIHHRIPLPPVPARSDPPLPSRRGPPTRFSTRRSADTRQHHPDPTATTSPSPHLDPSRFIPAHPNSGQFSEHLEPGQGDEDCLAPFEGNLPAGVALQHDLAGRHLDDPAPGTLRGTR